mmetsp:Transcript_16045/g.27060  ORF Transcript_16045/g.27060 Transcript_16045/m.27060 type:complete len:86 (-) Transcript_16045:735-992(-)
MLRQTGLGVGSQIVVYNETGEGGVDYAPSLWLRWVLCYYGFQNVKILDGGLNDWVSNHLPLNIPQAPSANPQNESIDIQAECAEQ